MEVMRFVGVEEKVVVTEEEPKKSPVKIRKVEGPPDTLCYYKGDRADMRKEECR